MNKEYTLKALRNILRQDTGVFAHRRNPIWD